MILKNNSNLALRHVSFKSKFWGFTPPAPLPVDPCLLLSCMYSHNFHERITGLNTFHLHESHELLSLKAHTIYSKAFYADYDINMTS